MRLLGFLRGSCSRDFTWALIPGLGHGRDGNGKLLVNPGIHAKQLFPQKSEFSFESHFPRIETEVAKYFGFTDVSLRP